MSGIRTYSCAPALVASGATLSASPVGTVAPLPSCWTPGAGWTSWFKCNGGSSEAVGTVAVASAAKAVIKTLTPRQLRLKALRATRHRVLYGEPRPPDEDLMLELRRRFKGEVVALSEYLGRDLVTLWGYDSVG